MPQTPRDEKLIKVFAANLSRELKKTGITPTELSKKCGLSNSAVFAFVHARNLPSVTTLKRIADILGTTCNELIYAASNRPRRNSRP